MSRPPQQPRAAPKVGIFGGTFNPVHLGHLRSAEEVREGQGLERVLFVPSARPPHKGDAHLAPAQHRLAMARLAVRGNPYFRVSTIEIDRGGRSYSVDTVRALRQREPGVRFVFILGLDAFRDISTWMAYGDLFGLCDLVVTSRPGSEEVALPAVLPVAVQDHFCYRSGTNTLEHRTGHTVVFQRLTSVDISATLVRALVRQKRSIRYLVPPAVERYVAAHRLYHPHPA